MLLVKNYTSIKQSLYSQMVAALGIYPKKEKFLHHPSTALIRLKNKGKCKLVYRSSLALRCANAYGVGVREIAGNLASHLAMDSDQKWQVQVSELGWLEIEVMSELLAAWLQSWVDLVPVQGNYFRDLGLTEMEFGVQYAHARCCGLVRLGIGEGLISPVDSETRIPWWDYHLLYFQEPAEWDFLGNLIDATDAIACLVDASVERWQRYALDVSRGFERFWAECNIFGATKIRNRQLAIARLGLVIVCRRVLQELLEKKLNQPVIYYL
ncbi:DALR anticodon-binding domain-containing protein [Calothrix sp. NIES-3974]|uniref:DALR anticodon-binding domain-containing protein n=1 Tax=Calothrix sp. NIES-3974 TaxID=2005462 RepID=UPI000BBCD08C|nr:DALR anticodon-binding domain-containing protein [Calothrix sp. NIES-3974]